MTGRLYLMLDCHAFMALPEDVEGALAKMQTPVQDYPAWMYGMLCCGDNEERRALGVCHAGKEWDEFEPRARAWLTKAIAYRSAADVEVDSWVLSRIRPSGDLPPGSCVGPAGTRCLMK